MLKNVMRLEKLFSRNNFVNVIRNKHLWTADNIVRSPFKDVTIPDLTFNEFIFKSLEKWPNKTAMVCGITNRQYTYQQLYKQSRILGTKLRKTFQIEDGDTVAIMLPNMPEYPAVVLGVLAAGGVVSSLNPLYSVYELQRQLSMSNPKVIFVANETVPVVKEALKLIQRDIPIIAINLNNPLPEGTIRYTELTEDNNVDLSVLKEVKRKHGDTAFLHYSSGTTGLPKAVELTHRNVVANCKQQSTELKCYDYTTENNQDTTLIVMPMFHSYGLNIAMLEKLCAGLKLVTLPRFQPDTMIDVLTNYKIDLIYLAPPLVLFLGSNPQITSKHFDRLRFVICGAAPLPQADIDRFLSKTVQDIHFGQGYGLTESGPLATISLKGTKNYESVGLPLPNEELRIVHENLKSLGPNEIGELLIKGPNIMKGYKDNPEANKAVFVDGGWLRTGDLAKIDEHGFVYIIDRLKELIKVSGFQVPPAELESVLKEHPAVLDAAVVGVKDATSGEKPKAFVVLNKGFELKSIDIIKFVNGRVAPYKKIKEVVILDAIPKNPSGKILRRVLAEKSS